MKELPALFRSRHEHSVPVCDFLHYRPGINVWLLDQRQVLPHKCLYALAADNQGAHFECDAHQDFNVIVTVEWHRRLAVNTPLLIPSKCQRVKGVYHKPKFHYDATLFWNA